MSASTNDIENARIRSVAVTDDELRVELEDGRAVAAPIGWYPRLVHGTPRERSRWELIGRGHGVHWPELDEDISVENILCGQPSAESASSFQRWLECRAKKAARDRSKPAARSA